MKYTFVFIYKQLRNAIVHKKNVNETIHRIKKKCKSDIIGKRTKRCIKQRAREKK